ncbi:MAG: hypothetical protein ACP5E3_08770 [Bacteroidales bacterium]
MILSKIFESASEDIDNRIISRASAGLFFLLFLFSISIPFLPFFSNVNHLLFKSLVFSLLFLILGYLLFKKRFSIIYGVFIGLIITRFLLNFIYLPSLQKNGQFSFKALTYELMELADYKDIYLTGHLDTFPVSLKFGSVELIQSKKVVKVPPMIPYQIPYYYTKETEKILSYEEYPKAGDYCISRRDYVPGYKTKEILVFDDHFLGYELVLFQVIDLPNYEDIIRKSE